MTICEKPIAADCAAQAGDRSDATHGDGGLVIGDAGRLAVRVERVIVPGLHRPCRIGWVSDLHLQRRAAIGLVRNVILAMRRAAPDVIVLGGDLVDRESGLPQLARLVRGLVSVAPVWALDGNHDRQFGVSRIAATVRGAGGAWLPGATALIAEGAVSLVTGDGRLTTARAAGFPVVCLHEPEGVRHWLGRASLALAGHVHGGQITLIEAFGRSWPAALAYRWCGPEFNFPGGMRLLVSRGAGALLPVRWRSPREIMCVDLVPDAPRDLVR